MSMKWYTDSNGFLIWLNKQPNDSYQILADWFEDNQTFQENTKYITAGIRYAEENQKFPKNLRWYDEFATWQVVPYGTTLPREIFISLPIFGVTEWTSDYLQYKTQIECYKALGMALESYEKDKRNKWTGPTK